MALNPVPQTTFFEFPLDVSHRGRTFAVGFMTLSGQSS